MKEHRFQIYSESKLIGYSDLENDDAPMGIAFGVFYPSEEYSGIEAQIEERVASNDFTALALSVKELATGNILENAYIEIVPPPKELPSETIQITIAGIPYPQYGIVFPEHVESYQKRYQ